MLSFVSMCGGFVGLFKKSCCSWRRRVRQKPASLVQLDMFRDSVNGEVFYVRSSKKRSPHGFWTIEEDVFGRSPMDSSHECP